MATSFATFNAYNNKQDGGRAKMSSDWPILTKLLCDLQRGCHTQATCLTTLRKVEGRSTFLATRNATVAVAKWGVKREFFLATCNATFVAMRVARKIASCNMALTRSFSLCSQLKALYHMTCCRLSPSPRTPDILISESEVSLKLLQELKVYTQSCRLISDKTKRIEGIVSHNTSHTDLNLQKIV